MINDLISVIIPVYNTEQYLKECIHSLLKQSYSGQYEIVLVDDGSTDHSGNICDEYDNQYSIVHAYHKKNGGLSDARNYGVRHSKGNILCFVDSDDFVHEDYLNRLYAIKMRYNVRIAECGCILYKEGDSLSISECNIDDKVLTSYEWITETGVGDFYPVVAWNKLYDRSLFDDVEFPVGRNFEDEATTYRLAYKCEKIARTYNKLYYYRQRQGSITKNRKTKKALEQQIMALDEKCTFFINRNENHIVPFCQAKYCILLISNYNMVDEIYSSGNNKKKEFVDTINERYNKWIRLNKSVPFKYRVYILYFLMTHSPWKGLQLR